MSPAYGHRDDALRSPGLYLPQSTRVLSARYAGGIRRVGHRIAAGASGCCGEHPDGASSGPSRMEVGSGLRRRLFLRALLFCPVYDAAQEGAQDGVSERVALVRPFVHFLDEPFCVFFRDDSVVLQLADGAPFVSEQHADGLHGERMPERLGIVLCQHLGDIVHPVDVPLNFPAERGQLLFLCRCEQVGRPQFVQQAQVLVLQDDETARHVVHPYDAFAEIEADAFPKRKGVLDIGQ